MFGDFISNNDDTLFGIGMGIVAICMALGLIRFIYNLKYAPKEVKYRKCLFDMRDSCFYSSIMDYINVWIWI